MVRERYNYGETIILSDDNWIGLGSSAARIIFDDQPTDQIEIMNANVGINATSPAAQLHIDQSATDGAQPVLLLDQGDLSEEFIKLIGQSAADNTQSLVDASDLTTPGNIVGWYKMYVQDDAASGGITGAVYYVPFYSTPTA